MDYIRHQYTKRDRLWKWKRKGNADYTPYHYIHVFAGDSNSLELRTRLPVPADCLSVCLSVSLNLRLSLRVKPAAARAGDILNDWNGPCYVCRGSDLRILGESVYVPPVVCRVALCSTSGTPDWVSLGLSPLGSHAVKYWRRPCSQDHGSEISPHSHSHKASTEGETSSRAEGTQTHFMKGDLVRGSSALSNPKCAMQGPETWSPEIKFQDTKWLRAPLA